jgi:hypothetical protein
MITRRLASRDETCVCESLGHDGSLLEAEAVKKISQEGILWNLQVVGKVWEETS